MSNDLRDDLMSELIKKSDLVTFPSLGSFFNPETTGFSRESFESFSGDISDSVIFVGRPLQAINELKIRSKSFDLIVFQPKLIEVIIEENKHSIEEITLYFIEFFEILRRLLSDEGSIYIDLDNISQAHLIKNAIDRVFGENNLINEILVRTPFPQKKEKGFRRSNHRIILFYSKSKNYIWNEQKKILTDRELSKKYPHVDVNGQYRLLPLYAPGIRKGSTGQQWKTIFPPEGKHWRYAVSKLDELDESGLIHWSKTGNPRLKEYLDINKETTPYLDYWDFSNPHTGGKLQEMYDVLIRSTTNESSKILYIASHQASPLIVAKNLNRKWNAITYDIADLFNLMDGLKKEFFLDSSVRAISTREFIEYEFERRESKKYSSRADLSNPSEYFDKNR